MQIEQIHGYNIGRQIGVGGMAEVYDATEHGLGNPVAVKFIKATFARESDYVERFLREARICADLSHPNIVKVLDVRADASSLPCIVMELLHGQTLRQRLKAGPMPEAEATAVARQMLSALVYAHQRSIVHRDIKPGNIFLCDNGIVKVMDFGIARATFEKRLTQTGVWMGTPEYMSPEQVGGKADARSDLYSLGIMMYEMLTGNVPFRATSPAGILHKHAYMPVPELPTRVTKQLRTTVARALEKDPGARFQSAEAMLSALPLPKPPPERMPMNLIALAMCSTTALLAVAAVLVNFKHEDREQARQGWTVRVPTPRRQLLPPEGQAQGNDAFIGLWTGPDGKEDYGKASTVTVAQVQQALDNGADIHAKDTAGTSALLLAAGGGSLDCMKFLMGQGLDIKDKNNNGGTALTRAATSGNMDCIRFCLTQGIDVNARNTFGETALKIAEENGHPEAANFLRGNGAVE